MWSADYGASAATIADFTVGGSSVAEMTIAREAGIGPAGEDGYSHTMATAGAGGGDFGTGWLKELDGAPFAYGDRVYFRWKYRLTTNGRFYEQGGGGGLAAIGRTKVIILNDGSSSSTSRVIVELEITRSPLSHKYGIQKGGGTDPDDTPEYSVDANWHSYQMCVRYSSSEGATDGGYDVWVDNTVEGSPDATVSGIVVNADLNPGDVKFMGYQNNGLYSDGTYEYEHVGFAVTDTFTAGWSV